MQRYILNLPFWTEVGFKAPWDNTGGWWCAGCWYPGNPGRNNPFPFVKNGGWNSGAGLKVGGGGWWRKKSLLVCACLSTCEADCWDWGDVWFDDDWEWGEGAGVDCCCCCWAVVCDWLFVVELFVCIDAAYIQHKNNKILSLYSMLNEAKHRRKCIKVQVWHQHYQERNEFKNRKNV